MPGVLGDAPLFGALLGGELLTSDPLCIFSQGTHRGFGNFNAFAAIDRSFSDIDSGKNFCPSALALNPQRHCSLHRIFGAIKPAAFDGPAHKILLFRCEFNLHELILTDSLGKIHDSEAIDGIASGVVVARLAPDCSRIMSNALCV